MYSPVKVIEVFLWGRRVGALMHDYDAYSVFEYDPEFRKSGIEVAPFMMPLSRSVYHAEEFRVPASLFAGLPGMIADSLPDAFGNALVRAYLEGEKIDGKDAFDHLFGKWYDNHHDNRTESAGGGGWYG